jgi:4-amino-4-deoxy-L-arabinose transferase-like glycosyltransferase
MVTAKERLSGVQWTLLAVIVVAAGVCRFARLAGPSLWMDEIWSIEISTGRGSAHAHLDPGIIHQKQIDLLGLKGAPPVWRIWPEMVNVPGHPPLYHIVLRLWMDLFGTGEFATRSLSCLASILGILVFFDICRLLHGNVAALWSAAIMALALGQLEFAQQARSYALLILLALATADALVRIQKLGLNWRRVGSLILFAAGTALTHYFSAGLLLALGVYGVLLLRGRVRWQTFGGFGLALVLAIVLWGPWIGKQIQNRPTAEAGWVAERTPEHIQYTFERIIGMPAIYLFGAHAGDAVAVVCALTLVIPWIRLRQRPDLLLWCLWAVGTIGFVAAIDFTHPTKYLSHTRYTVLASPAIFALLGSIDLPRGKLLGQLVPAVMVIALAMFVGPRLKEGAPAEEDWRLLARSLDNAAGPGDLVICYGTDPWIPPGMRYLGIQYYLPGSKRPWLILHGKPGEKLKSEMARYPSVWLVSRDPVMDASALIPDWGTETYPHTSAGEFARLIPSGRATASSRP